MLNKNKKILTLKVKEHCYVSTSVRNSEITGNGMKTITTFEFCKDGICVSIEPDYGPLIIYKATETKLETQNFHHILGEVEDNSYWSQALVGSLKIKEALVAGDYDKVFSILEEQHKQFDNKKG